MTALTITPPSNLGMIANIEDSQFVFGAYTLQWSAGSTIGTNRSARFGQPTYAFTSASTLATGVDLDVAAPTAGTNATITSAIALRAGSNNTQVSASGFSYHAIDVPAHTLTLTGTTQVTNVSAASGVNIGQITLTDASGVTVNNAASLHIVGAPVPSGSLSLTNPWAILVDAGNVKFAGSLTLGSPLAVVSGGTGGSTGVTTGSTAAMPYIASTGTNAASISFPGSFSSSSLESVKVKTITCTTLTAGTLGTNGWKLKVRDLTAPSDLCVATTFASCSEVALSTHSFICSGNVIATNINTLQFNSTSDCGTYPVINCNVELQNQ